jgi:hypothetical protein
MLNIFNIGLPKIPSRYLEESAPAHSVSQIRVVGVIPEGKTKGRWLSLRPPALVGGALPAQ